MYVYSFTYFTKVFEVDWELMVINLSYVRRKSYDNYRFFLLHPLAWPYLVLAQGVLLITLTWSHLQVGPIRYNARKTVCTVRNNQTQTNQAIV